MILIDVDDWMDKVKEINSDLNKGKPSLTELVNSQIESTQIDDSGESVKSHRHQVNEIIACKHCGASKGFFVKERVTGTAIIYYTNRGDYAAENDQMYDSLSHSGGRTAFCSNCEKPIGKSEKLKSHMTEDMGS